MYWTLSDAAKTAYNDLVHTGIDPDLAFTLLDEHVAEDVLYAEIDQDET